MPSAETVVLIEPVVTVASCVMLVAVAAEPSERNPNHHTPVATSATRTAASPTTDRRRYHGRRGPDSEPGDGVSTEDGFGSASVAKTEMALSELIAQSESKEDLTRRIATEQQQLVRSARLMAAASVPGPLSAVNDRMVRALRRFSRDFGRAKAPAARGDFTAAVTAMTDKPTVSRIIAAATTIQRACQP